jgi:putative inorganic carbon (HCO3(-)) transporter
MERTLDRSLFPAVALARSVGWPLLAAVRFAPWLYLGMLLIFLFRPPDVDLYGLDRLGFAVVCSAALLRTLLQRPARTLSGMLWPMGGLLVLATLSAVQQPYAAQTWSLLAAKFAVPFTLFAIAPVVFDGEDSAVLLENFLLVVLGYLVITALAVLFDIRVLVLPQYILDTDLGIHADRARGPFLQSVANGVTLNLLGLLALERWRQGRMRTEWAVVLAGGVVLAIVATMTRAVWISFVVSMVGAMLWRHGARKALLAVAVAGVLLVAGIVFTGQSDRLQERAAESGPVEIRLAVYEAAVGMIQERPLLGWGTNRMPEELALRLEGYRLQSYWAHNTYLEILVEHGVFGLGLYLWMLLGMFRLGRDRGRPTSQAGTLGSAGFRRLWPVLIGVYAFNACFVVMNYQFVNALLFTLAGLLAAATPRREEARVR